VKKGAYRHFGNVLASQRGAQGSEFALALHGQRSKCGTGQQGAGHRQALAVQGEGKLATLRAALAADDTTEMPIRAFLHDPLDIYWCP